MQRRYALSGLAIAIAATFSGATLAQTSETPEVETITVLGETYRNTATKTALSPEETPQAISVVDRETLDLRGTNSVSEALRYVSGVNTELRGGAVTRLDLFNIRGFINYQNFYDGLQLPYLSGWNLQAQVDDFAVQQVEVFKGPTSVLYGNIPPGGMVNLIAKSPQKEAQTTVEISTGTRNLKEANLDTTGQFGNSDVNYRILALARQRDSQANTAEDERYLIAPSFDWQASDATLVNVNLYYQKDPSAGIYTTLPAQGTVLPNPEGPLSPDTFTGDANWNEFDREVLMAGYKILHDFNEDWSILHNLRYSDASLHQTNTYNGALAADHRTLSRNAYQTNEALKFLTLDNQLSGKHQWGSVEHNLLIGLDYQQMDSSVRYQDTLDFSAPSLDLYNPDNHQIDPNNLNLKYNKTHDIQTSQLGVYLQDQIRWNQLVMIAGGRYDHYTLDQKTDGVKSGDIDKKHFTGRIGALYHLGNGFSPYVSYSESFEPVAGQDRFGKVFDPSEGQQWEAGVKYQSEDGTQTASLAAYRLTKQNVVTRDPNGSAYDKIQTGEIQTQGLEFESLWLFTSNFDLVFNYTFTDAEITKDHSGLKGNTPVWVPEQMASLWTNYYIDQGMLSGTTLGAGVRYVGESELDAQNSGKVPDYTLFDLSARYQFGELDASLDRMTATLSASNLFDETYYTCFDQNNCWFGAERTIEAKIAFHF
ncbi:TonB-dependent siderophore receptor [Photobacterium sp. 1_MG-2023]|uniref:TonB-dependent siderophore receptor n=1 Tax=Photobacterium sp. 1_MG-2023 TaxID=3062646 RepID=UPI0026E2FAA4|nr:TonB-dependent siderophore receptor [Photobacterium sp. 1_MG-2023]MDO6708841.1 TonB-dependent siderophore receptor [Photobacterium sp. 1_MG-2023]